MHVNYEYLLDFIQRTYSNPATGRFLDYGCGAAQVVMEGRRRGWEFFGADVFYATGKSRKEVEERGLLGVIVKEIQDNHLDFPDEYFDIIVNNQVFEHVEDINGALREIDRVLKPGGIVLSVFPAKGIVIEPHWKVPFVHWFPKQSSLRLYYAWLLRCGGFGYWKKNKPKYKWAQDLCAWIDQYTYYRKYQEIDLAFKHVFSKVMYIEDDYLLFRLKTLHPRLDSIQPLLRTPLLGSLLKELSRRGGSVVIKSLKSKANSPLIAQGSSMLGAQEHS